MDSSGSCEGTEKKANYSAVKINRALDFLEELGDYGFIRIVPVSPYLEKAKELIKELNLYASDAIHLATAIVERLMLISEDRHLSNEKVSSYCEKYGVRVIRLSTLYNSTI